MWQGPMMALTIEVSREEGLENLAEKIFLQIERIRMKREWL
jgi:hypothetical protein